MRLLLISLLLSFVMTNCPSESGTELVDMTATVNPQEAGSVNPPEGTYFSGREITVEAVAADSQWEFTGWSGDIEASDDSLTFTITEDVDLVANYEVSREDRAFTNRMTITDGENSKDILFGMKEGATTEFDSGIDKQLPNIPPPDGAFYRRLRITDYSLKEDYRGISDQQTIWVLEFAPEGDRTITLKWDFSETSHDGTLIMTDDTEDPSFEIDMKSQTSYKVPDQSLNTVYIISN